MGVKVGDYKWLTRGDVIACDVYEILMCCSISFIDICFNFTFCNTVIRYGGYSLFNILALIIISEITAPFGGGAEAVKAGNAPGPFLVFLSNHQMKDCLSSPRSSRRLHTYVKLNL